MLFSTSCVRKRCNSLLVNFIPIFICVASRGATLAASPMPCARWCRAQVDFEPETFIIYIPAFNRRQHPQSHADLALSANRAHALSLNAVIDALDAKRYDSPFVFGFILLSRRPWGCRNPYHSGSMGRPTAGTQMLCECGLVPT